MVSDTRVERGPGLVVVKDGWVVGSSLGFCGWKMGRVDDTPVACLFAFLDAYEPNIFQPVYSHISVMSIIEFYEHCERRIPSFLLKRDLLSSGHC